MSPRQNQKARGRRASLVGDDQDGLDPSGCRMRFPDRCELLLRPAVGVATRTAARHALNPGAGRPRRVRARVRSRRRAHPRRTLPPVATTGLHKGLQVRRTRPSLVGHPHPTRRSHARAPTSTRWTLRGRRSCGPSPNQKTKRAREQEKTRSPLTDSNCRPLLTMRFWSVPRVHARSSATQFLLQIGLLQAVEMRRETSCVSFLMCPFCVRALVPG